MGAYSISQSFKVFRKNLFTRSRNIEKKIKINNFEKRSLFNVSFGYGKIEDDRQIIRHIVDITGRSVHIDDFTIGRDTVIYEWELRTNRGSLRKFNGSPSWICPKTWYFGLTLCWTVANNSTHPARTFAQTKSPWPSGGVCVTRTSVSFGIRSHFSNNCAPLFKLKPQLPNSGCLKSNWIGIETLAHASMRSAIPKYHN